MIYAVFEPRPHISPPDCQGCYNQFKKGDIVVVEDLSMLDRDKHAFGDNKEYYCIECWIEKGRKDLMNSLLEENTLRTEAGKATPYERLREVVRAQLKQIIKEECADPDGALSPAKDRIAE